MVSTTLFPPLAHRHNWGQIGYNIRVQSIWEKYHHPTTIEAKKNEDIALVYIVYNIRVQTPDTGGPITKTKYNVTKNNTLGPIQASSGTTRPDQSPIMSEMEKEEIFRGSIGSQDIIGKVNHSKRKKNNF